MLDLTTPSLLFSAISLILLAYTNRFLAYTNVVRSLTDQYERHGNPQEIEQIRNLRKRLSLIQSMQILGISSLLLCVVAMFFIYIHLLDWAIYLFGAALVLLAASLCVCVWEINISVKALDIHLRDMSPKQKLKQ